MWHFVHCDITWCFIEYFEQSSDMILLIFLKDHVEEQTAKGAEAGIFTKNCTGYHFLEYGVQLPHIRNCFISP